MASAEIRGTSVPRSPMLAPFIKKLGTGGWLAFTQGIPAVLFQGILRMAYLISVQAGSEG